MKREKKYNLCFEIPTNLCLMNNTKGSNMFMIGLML